MVVKRITASLDGCIDRLKLNRDLQDYLIPNYRFQASSIINAIAWHTFFSFPDAQKHGLISRPPSRHTFIIYDTQSLQGTYELQVDTARHRKFTLKTIISISEALKTTQTPRLGVAMSKSCRSVSVYSYDEKILAVKYTSAVYVYYFGVTDRIQQ